MNVDGEKGTGKWTVDADGAFSLSGSGLECSGTLKNGVLILKDALGEGLDITFLKDGASDTGSAAKEETKDAEAGGTRYYKLVSLGEGDDAMTAEDLAPLANYVILYENNTGWVCLFDEAYKITWAQQAKLLARQIQIERFNVKGLTKAIPEIRKMSTLKPEEFCPRLEATLANNGVALVFLPHLKGSFLQGASFADGNKIVLGLTARGKDADRFWFSLFHGKLLPGGREGRPGRIGFEVRAAFLRAGRDDRSLFAGS